jgi:hypothetical protein
MGASCEDRAEFGVLYVAGIGSGRPGGAVAALGAALFGWLFRWNRCAELSDPGAPVLGDTVLSPAADGPAHLILTTPLLLSGGRGRRGGCSLNLRGPPCTPRLGSWSWCGGSGRCRPAC